MDSKLTFGGVVVSTPHPQKDPVVRRTYAATELTPSSMLHTVELRISVNPPPDTKVYTIFGGQAVDLAAGKEFVLSVPVRWKGNLPHTRERGVDNVDAWIVGADGGFDDTAGVNGLITRRYSCRPLTCETAAARAARQRSYPDRKRLFRLVGLAAPARLPEGVPILTVE